jgi:hypothetical protein
MAKEPQAAAGRANTPEVDEWLQKSNNLTNAAIALAAYPIDQDTAAMMRQVQSGCMVLLTALQRLQLPAA